MPSNPNNPCSRCGGFPRAKSSAKCSKCQREYNREYRQSHPEAERRKYNKWLQSHRETRRAINLAYSRRHPDRMLARSKRYFESHPEKARQYTAKYRETHRAKRREAGRDYMRRNRVKCNINWHRRRARLRSNGGSYTPLEWQALCEQYDYTCLRCGKQAPDIKLTVDHVIPIVKGGTNAIENLQPLCLECNSAKHDDVIDYRTMPVPKQLRLWD